MLCPGNRIAGFERCQRLALERARQPLAGRERMRAAVRTIAYLEQPLSAHPQREAHARAQRLLARLTDQDTRAGALGDVPGMIKRGEELADFRLERVHGGNSGLSGHHGTQAAHFARDGLYGPLDVLGAAEATQAEAQRALSELGIAAERP